MAYEYFCVGDEIEQAACIYCRKDHSSVEYTGYVE
jgi:hypothetical protein